MIRSTVVAIGATVTTAAALAGLAATLVGQIADAAKSPKASMGTRVE